MATQLFEATSNTYSEHRKAALKNYNFPILQSIYNGNEDSPIKCMITNSPGIVKCSGWGNNKTITRVMVDIDHIRQKLRSGSQAGNSVDKRKSDPSALIRDVNLDDPYHERSIYAFYEMVGSYPISTQEHSFKTQCSAKYDLTLVDYDTKCSRTFVLENEQNYDSIFNKHNMPKYINYSEMIDILSDINKPPIYKIIEPFIKKKFNIVNYVYEQSLDEYQIPVVESEPKLEEWKFDDNFTIDYT